MNTINLVIVNNIETECMLILKIEYIDRKGKRKSFSKFLFVGGVNKNLMFLLIFYIININGALIYLIE